MRDLAITAAVLMGLFIILSILPFILTLLVMLVIGGVIIILGYLIYACVHDSQIQEDDSGKDN
jgi:predicted membrane channel-forming protein YqfA (hemolysin III family)